jgi:hypothetical protein
MYVHSLNTVRKINKNFILTKKQEASKKKKKPLFVHISITGGTCRKNALNVA